MPIKINSTGGGSVSIDVPSTGGTYTLTAPANNATIFTTAGGAITGNVAFTSNNVTIGGQTIAPNLGMKNRIINGDMRIDQRNNGQASIVGLSLDRWLYSSSNAAAVSIQQNAGSVTPPTGFNYYQGMTSRSSNTIGSTDYAIMLQGVEGLNVTDLNWGTSAAKPVTLSFWTYSSLTGTYSLGIRNSTGALTTRSYLTTYNINSANTWEQKTITIPGDTAGTWASNTFCGLSVNFGLGVGSTYSTSSTNTWLNANFLSASGSANLISTLGATWYLTGVQLESGSVATPFEFRSYGSELALCQRYYFRVNASGGQDSYMPRTTPGISWSTTATSGAPIIFPVTMRATPTFNKSGLRIYSPNIGGFSATVTFGSGTNESAFLGSSGSSGLTQGVGYLIVANASTDYYEFSAEY